jgi:hypothetical protein
MRKTLRLSTTPSRCQQPGRMSTTTSDRKPAWATSPPPSSPAGPCLLWHRLRKRGPGGSRKQYPLPKPYSHNPWYAKRRHPTGTLQVSAHIVIKVGIKMPEGADKLRRNGSMLAISFRIARVLTRAADSKEKPAPARASASHAVAARRLCHRRLATAKLFAADQTNKFP